MSRPLPDGFTIFSDLPDTVERDGDQFTLFVFKLKGEVVPLFEDDLIKRYVHIAIKHMILVADDKVSPPEYLVPAYPVEQIDDAYHFNALNEIKTIKVHHLGPCRYKINHELLLSVSTAVDFSQSTELGI